MENNNNQSPDDKFHYYSNAIKRDLGNLVKWLLLAVVVGCITGAASTLFSVVLKAVTSYRKANSWIFYFMPLAGLCIVFLYEKFGKDEFSESYIDSATVQLNSIIDSKEYIYRPVLREMKTLLSELREIKSVY